MVSLSPIKIPPPEKPSQDDESTRREEEEKKLCAELLNLIFSKQFKYSRRVVEKAKLEGLKDIKLIYGQQRARHLIKTEQLFGLKFHLLSLFQIPS